MAWTTPSTVVAGSTELTAALWNEQVRDNLNAVSRGIIAKATTSTSTAYTGTATDSGLSVTWTAESDRIYLIVAQAYVNKDATAGYVQLKITDSSNTVKQIGEPYLTGNTATTVHFSLYESGLSGSVTRKLRYGASAGQARIEASGTYPTQVIVMDLGLA